VSVRVALAQATEVLRAAGVASPEHDARALAAHAAGVRFAEVVLLEQVPSSFVDLVARRAARVPLQHLIGSVGFRWIDLEVGPGVFVPRPETEVVVEQALALVAEIAEPRVVDLCTGSGAIALSFAHERPGSAVHALEIDPVALGWTRRNAARFRPIDLRQGGVEGCFPDLDGQVDLVVSNPPYVPTTERHLSAPEVLEHDPDHAVFAGEDGLEVIRQVEVAARRLLRPGGWVVVEHADSQQTSAPAVFGDGWSDVRDHDDLTGRPRFVTARRTPS
jgi:release factor glutamine methyltransferase